MSETSRPDEPPAVTTIHRSRLIRGLYFAAGIAALIAAVLGVVLPILPTTPFVLLAAACFAKSSDRFYNGLLRHRIAGPIISDWREHGAMKREAKRWALFMMALSFGTSMLIMSSVWHRVMLIAMALVLGTFIWRVPVRPEPNPSIDSHIPDGD